MEKRLRLLACFLCVSFHLSCAGKQDLFVLVPDPEGKVGEIEVSTKDGSQVLNRPYEATKVKSAEKAPSKPIKMDEKEVSEIFKQAIDAQPTRPVTFILHFETDSTILVDESKKILLGIMAAIKERHSKDVSVVGHTDTYGSKEYNFQLSQRRAATVGDQLIFLGADPGIIEISSHGERNPLIKTADNVREPRNRRVEVTVR